MPYLVSQYDFTHGEASPVYTGRSDLSMYSKSASLIKNMMVKANGSLRSRFGSKRLLSITGDVAETCYTWSFGNGNDTYNYLVIVDSTNIQIYDLDSNTIITTISNVIDIYVKIRTFQQNNYFVILSGQNTPFVLTGDLSTGSITGADIQYSHPPTAEFDNRYAYGTTFTLTKVERTAPGTATSSLPILEITNMGTFGGFTADFVGGEFTSLGPTTDDEDGVAIIEEFISSTQVRVRIKNEFQKIPGYTSGNEGSFNGSECNLTEQAYTTNRGFPTTGGFFQNRLMLAGGKSTPQMIFGSQTGDYDNFSLGTGLDNEGIQTVLSGNGDTILNIVASKTLQIFTKNGEYSTGLWEAKTLTPSTVSSITLQSSFGSSDVQPITLDNQTIFCKGGGKAIMSFGYPIGSTSYISSNLSFYSEHLIKNPICIASLSNNNNFDSNTLFVINSDNTMSVLEILPEQEVQAWTRFETKSEIYFGQEPDQYLSVFSLKDRVFITVSRNNGFFLEELVNEPIDSYTNNYTISGNTLSLGTGYSNNIVHAIAYNDNNTVNYIGSFTTDNNGDADVGDFDSGDFNNAIIGYSFEQHVRSMPAHIMTQNGDNRYLKKKLSKIYVEYSNSYSFKIGTEYPSQLSDDPDNSNYWTFNSIQVPVYKYSTISSPTINYDRANHSKSGIFESDINSGHSRNTYISIKQDLPLPLEILGYAAQMSV